MMALAEPLAARSDGSGAMFDRIATRYDLLNRLNSLGFDRAWRRVTAEALAPAAAADRPLRVLDVASGTGDLAIAIARRFPSAVVSGVDTSAAMTGIGQGKVESAGLAERVTLASGDAQELGFPDRSFDAAAIAFGIRNVPDRVRALREMARVTRPGGRVAVLELSEPASGPLAALARFHIRVLVPLIGALVAGGAEYRYLRRSIRAFPPPDQFARTMTAAGLAPVETRPLTFGVCNLFLASPVVGHATGDAGS
ncbi:MAG: ubiquinone/menaquinone biosynthesis methyltransferase [Holophagales bacterium]|nr:ubiquinone/menaquinone biosynthesis methyltransferase [Holophagales bacterium]MYF94276.1 ubiquinone/menaquinone biosynthesis methyltransferase [Holophagales bacterium]